MQCHLLSQNLYESIKNEPFKIPEDDGNDLTHTFFNPDREGWLLKLGESLLPASQCGVPAVELRKKGYVHTGLGCGAGAGHGHPTHRLP